MMNYFCLLFFLVQTPFVKEVRLGTLDMNPNGPLGMVTDGYPFFTNREWTESPGEGGLPQVRFVGEFEYAPTYAAFQEKYKGPIETGLKLMQMPAYYKLPEKMSHLRIQIVFQFRTDNSFIVHSGSLGWRNGDSEWQDNSLSNKSLLALITGLYSRQNPFKSLLDGLPYK